MLILKRLSDTFYEDWKGQRFIRLGNTFFPIYTKSFDKSEVSIISETQTKQNKAVFNPPKTDDSPSVCEILNRGD